MRPKIQIGRFLLTLVAITSLVSLVLLSGKALGDSAGATTEDGATFSASVEAGDNVSCVVLSTGDVRCWGDNTYGQLGNGDTIKVGDNEQPWQNVNLGGAKATAVDAGTQHVCVLLVGGNVRCWGRNQVGQLGLGSTTTIGDDESPTTNVDLGGATAIAISANDDNTCVILGGGSVRCWGDNTFGQLGLGNTTTIGDDESPTANVNLGGTQVRAITAGDHTCVILVNGQVRCWGLNNQGQLGLGNTTTIGDDESPATNVNLGGSSAVAIARGDFRTCVILVGGQVRCWGWNNDGQLGLGNTATIGDNENPTTNVNLGPVGATAISSAGDFTCIVTTQNRARCWGKNWRGWLGRGDAETIGDSENPAQDVNLGSVSILAISSGREHSCVLLDTRDVRCWGDNWYGQLGLGNTNTVGDNESPSANVSFFGAVTVGPTTTTSSTTTTSTSTTTTTTTLPQASSPETTTTPAPAPATTQVQQQPVPSSTTTSSPPPSQSSVSALALRVGQRQTIANLLSVKKVVRPSGSTASIAISKSSRTVCAATSTSIRGLKRGTCRFNVSIRSKSGKSSTVTFSVVIG
jgi:alpha-tubulin suppressor-like RCC1 family protein